MAQQRALLGHVISAYEADVRRLVHVPLTQAQFDALVSFDCNMGAGNLYPVAKLLNEGDYDTAANILEHFNDGDAGLRKRRRAEAAMFRAPPVWAFYFSLSDSSRHERGIAPDPDSPAFTPAMHALTYDNLDGADVLYDYGNADSLEKIYYRCPRRK